MELDDIYRSHPLSKRTILARVAAQRVPPDRITEWHLAVDPLTELTDQNHSGGVEATLELASLAGIDRDSTVVDIGAGLGGPARVLAEAYRCRVVGVEQDAGRCRDAVELTRIVALTDRVDVWKQDALASAPGVHHVDVLWGQATWVHFPDPDAFLERWLPALRPGGRVAMADSHLKREPASAAEKSLVRQLEDAWGAHLRPIDEWQRALEARRCAVLHRQERTDETLLAFRRLMRVSASWPAGTVTDAERRSWELAMSAYASELIGAYQLVARQT
ncbi:MAG TPA: methyltransferase domain-containing protein [Vicinamibacterales bacterium]|nr:methyltransferase domain-containing protein [Vicinamibacterales bacterium]